MRHTPLHSHSRRRPGRHWLWPLLLFAGLASTAHAGESQNACGNPFKNHFGPFDYRTPGPHLELVERYHFTPGVESLTRPMNTTMLTMAADVGYTLHVFPNHPRALRTMVHAGEQAKSDMPPGASFTIDCYFQRGVAFAPDDTVVRNLYARYLFKKNRKAEASQQLEAAEGFAKDNAISHFNIGISYFEMGDYERALTQAHLAQSLGLEWPQLGDMLKRANKWREPTIDQAAQVPAEILPHLHVESNPSP